GGGRDHGRVAAAIRALRRDADSPAVVHRRLPAAVRERVLRLRDGVRDQHGDGHHPAPDPVPAPGQRHHRRDRPGVCDRDVDGAAPAGGGAADGLRQPPGGDLEPAVRRGTTLRLGFIVVLTLYFAVPMIAMTRFAFQRTPVALLTPDNLLDHWTLQGLETALRQGELHHAAWVSCQLAILSVLLNMLLLLPAAITTDLYYPRFKGTLTMITLLPWVIPPIALVVGIAATVRNFAPSFLASPVRLVPFYALTAMPFTYRALDAGLQSISARTLNEAARSLGARTSTIMVRVLIPNLGASLIASSVLTVALVLGEF